MAEKLGHVDNPNWGGKPQLSSSMLMRGDDGSVSTAPATPTPASTPSAATTSSTCAACKDKKTWAMVYKVAAVAVIAAAAYTIFHHASKTA